ncbi:MAG: flagellar assembly protein FliW [Marmoricola sp.]
MTSTRVHAAPSTDATTPVEPVVELVRPLLGFPTARRYTLAQLAEDGSLYALRSLDDPDLRFLLVPAGRFFPAYSPVVDDSVVDELGIRAVEDVLVLVLLTAGSSLATTTANLLAPILLNVPTGQAAQVVLDDPSLSLHAPLVA